MTRKIKRYLQYTIAILISILFLSYSLIGVKITDLSTVVEKADWWFILATLASCVIFYWIKAFRWKLLLLPIRKLPTKELLSPMMVGVFFNFLLFGYIGEFIRTHYIGLQKNLKYSPVLATIYLERLLDLFSIIFMLGVGIASSGFLPSGVISISFFIFFFLIVLGLLVFTGLIALCPKPFLHYFSHLMCWLPKDKQNSIIHHLEHAILGLKVTINPTLFSWLVVISLIQWSFMGFSHYFALKAFGIIVPITIPFIIITLITFGIALPSAPGHIGLIQFCYVLALKPLGIGSTNTFAAATIYHLTLFFSIVSITGIFMYLYGITFQEAREKGKIMESKMRKPFFSKSEGTKWIKK